MNQKAVFMRIVSTTRAAFTMIMIASAAAQTPDAQSGLVNAAPIPAGPIHIGPVYTQGEQVGAYPKYPDLQIQVDVPPNASPELLRPEAFRLKADSGKVVNASREQTLASTGYGVAASVALDVSGSMKGKPLDAVRSGLIKFVGDAGPQDKVAVQTIADESRWDANWDAPRDQVRDALDKLSTRGKLTRLWDALLDAIQRFPASPLSRHLIVISDGHDEGSSHHPEEVIAAARNKELIVDAIGITRSDPVYLQALESLASQTGGHFRQAKDSNELEELVGGGIQRLKSTPVVSFRLDDLPADGQPHHFEVTWIHDGSESHGEIMASIPLVSPGLDKRWYLRIAIAAAALLLLILLIVVLLLVRKRPAVPVSTRMEPGQMPRAIAQPVPYVGQYQSPAPPRPYIPSVSGGASQQASVMAQELPPRPKFQTGIMSRFPAPAKGRPSAWLLGEAGPVAGKRFPVDEIEYWVGALENNHLRIPDDPTLSGNHACLRFDHEVLGIHDYHSTNGTRVNGAPVGEKRCLLRIGDRITMGQSTFVLQSADPNMTVVEGAAR